MKKHPSRTFRPWKANQERLAFAGEKLQLNVSELINEVLEKHLRDQLEAKAKALREAYSVPIP